MRKVLLFAFIVSCAAAVHAQTVSIGTDNAAALKGARRLAIDQFGVEFITVLKANGGGGGASASVQAELKGVSDEAMQALTERVYRDTVTALGAAGFEVVPFDSVQARPEYQEIANRIGKPVPYEIDDSASVSKIFAPAGMKAFFQTSGGRGSLAERNTAFDGANGAKSSALAKGMDLHFVRFHYLASFGTAAASKGFLANVARRASASVEAGPVLLPNETQAQIVSQDGQRVFRTSSRGAVNGAVYVDKPVRGPVEGFELVDTTTAESKQSDNVSNALQMGLSLLTGTRARSTQHRSASVTLSEATFNESYLRMIGAARDALIVQLQSAAK